MNEKKPTILIADDEPEVLGLMQRALSEVALVVTARDGAEALASFFELRPDLVLLDIHMPGGTGIDVCARIKASTPTTDFIPVILMTAATEEGLRQRGLDAGADEYLQKPLDLPTLRARIRMLLKTCELFSQVRTLQSEVRGLKGTLEAQSPFPDPPHLADVTVLFSDIRRFTQISDQLEIEDVVTVVDRYVSHMSGIVVSNGGIVNKVMGDGLLVLFEGDPLESRTRGLRCALQMRQAAHQLDAELHSRLPERLHVGIGLHSGEAIVGPIGGDLGRDYTAIGSAVNLAARLQGLAAGGQIVASHNTYGPLGPHIDIEDEHRHELKGFAHPVRIARILAGRL